VPTTPTTHGADHRDGGVHAEFPLASFLGMTVERPTAGLATTRLTARPDHLNPHGTVHGAVFFALVDTAMGAATMGVLGEGDLCASIDVQLRFLRPVVEGELVATAEVVQAGRRIVHLEGRVHDGLDRVAAMATGSFAVIAPGRAG
jgi:acyl-CoA thioesterase